MMAIITVKKIKRQNRCLDLERVLRAVLADEQRMLASSFSHPVLTWKRKPRIGTPKPCLMKAVFGDGDYSSKAARGTKKAP